MESLVANTGAAMMEKQMWLYQSNRTDWHGKEKGAHELPFFSLFLLLRVYDKHVFLLNSTVYKKYTILPCNPKLQTIPCKSKKPTKSPDSSLWQHRSRDEPRCNTPNLLVSSWVLVGFSLWVCLFEFFSFSHCGFTSFCTITGFISRINSGDLCFPTARKKYIFTKIKRTMIMTRAYALKYDQLCCTVYVVMNLLVFGEWSFVTCDLCELIRFLANCLNPWALQASSGCWYTFELHFPATKW